MLELFPDGFEERDGPDGLELVAYTDSSGEERLWHAFGGARSDTVDVGWEQRWRDFHRPIRVGQLWVGPPWLEPPPDTTTVVVDPGRAFGTGAHATTRLCLELLLGLPRGSFLDVGCGSGVIAIAAAKLGFDPVAAIDVDPVAVEVTCANARANGVEVEVALADALTDSLPAADTIVANISIDAIRLIAGRVCCRCLIVSGFLASEALDPGGLDHAARIEAEGWAADLFERE